MSTSNGLLITSRRFHFHLHAAFRFALPWKSNERDELAENQTANLQMPKEKETNQNRLHIVLVTFLRLQTQTLNMAPGGGNRNCSRAELFNVLAPINKILPVGGEDWNAVLEAHSVDFPGREVDSLRRAFSLLHRK
jgi:hypothetical protein